MVILTIIIFYYVIECQKCFENNLSLYYNIIILYISTYNIVAIQYNGSYVARLPYNLLYLKKSEANIVVVNIGLYYIYMIYSYSNNNNISWDGSLPCSVIRRFRVPEGTHRNSCDLR